jgi:hypothetical protein
MTSFKESLFVKDNSPGWEWSCIHSTSSTGMFCTKGRAHPTDPLCSPWSFPDRTFIASSQGIIGNGQTLKGLMSGWLHIIYAILRAEWISWFYPRNILLNMFGWQEACRVSACRMTLCWQSIWETQCTLTDDDRAMFYHHWSEMNMTINLSCYYWGAKI